MKHTINIGGNLEGSLNVAGGDLLVARVSHNAQHDTLDYETAFVEEQVIRVDKHDLNVLYHIEGTDIYLEFGGSASGVYVRVLRNKADQK